MAVGRTRRERKEIARRSKSYVAIPRVSRLRKNAPFISRRTGVAGRERDFRLSRAGKISVGLANEPIKREGTKIPIELARDSGQVNRRFSRSENYNEIFFPNYATSN